MEKNAPQWYALKVFYNKVFEMEDLLCAMGMETFLAVEKVQLKGAEHVRARKIISKRQSLRRTFVSCWKVQSFIGENLA